jgi:hypothetical protein
MPLTHAPQVGRPVDRRRWLRAGLTAWLGVAAALLATSTTAAVIPIAGRHAELSRTAPTPAAEASRHAASATAPQPAAAAVPQRAAPVSTPSAVRSR